jgi:hypothetical protein
MSVNEALKLSDKQVNFMLEQADLAARQVLASDAGFRQALSDKLAPTKRAVRADLEGSSATPDSTRLGIAVRRVDDREFRSGSAVTADF